MGVARAAATASSDLGHAAERAGQRVPLLVEAATKQRFVARIVLEHTRQTRGCPDNVSCAVPAAVIARKDEEEERTRSPRPPDFFPHAEADKLAALQGGLDRALVRLDQGEELVGLGVKVDRPRSRLAQLRQLWRSRESQAPFSIEYNISTL